MDRVASTPGKECTLTLYILSEGGEGDIGQIGLYFYKGEGIIPGQGGGCKIAGDFPFWKKVEVKVMTPAEAVQTCFDASVWNTKATVWVDDVSFVQDGKNVLRNGSFEDR
jgi:hypothetical protein